MNYQILGYDESRTLEKNRGLILETARRLFIENGIESSSIIQISKECGMTRRSIYNYYDTKDEIAVDVQILNLDGMKFFEHWNLEIGRGRTVDELLSRIDFLAESALTVYRQNYLMIHRFDSYFSTDYPNDRYINFLRLNMESTGNYYLSGLQPESSEKEWYLVSLVVAYIQRLVLRSCRSPIHIDDIRGELEAFSEMLRIFYHS